MTLNDVFMTIRIGFDETEGISAEIRCDKDLVRICPEIKDGSIFLTDCLLARINSIFQPHKESIEFEFVNPGDLKVEVLDNSQRHSTESTI